MTKVSLPTKKNRTNDPASKRESILNFAYHLFVTQGYHRVSIPTIVAASGISTGSIYNLFGSKENIARTLHKKLMDNFMLSFRSRLQDCTTTYEKLRAFAELVYEQTEKDPHGIEFILFMRHGEFIADISPVCMTEPFMVIREIIKDGMACGDIKKGDFFICAVSYTGAILRPAQLQLECILPKPLSEASEELIDNAWAAIKS